MSLPPSPGRFAQLPGARWAAAAATIGILAAAPGVAAPAFADLPSATQGRDGASSVTVQAQGGTPLRQGGSNELVFTSQFMDPAGVVKDSDEAEINDLLRKGISESGIKAYVAFVDSTVGTPEQYATQIQNTQGSNNTYFLIVDVKTRRYGVAYGSRVKKSTASKITERAEAPLRNLNWTLAAKEVGHEVADTSDPKSLAWMGAAGAAAVGAGAGAVALARRHRRKTEKEQLAVARALPPTATSALADQPTSTLRTLAQDELTSTDQSIRKGEQELNVALGEFGAERTRELQRALENSKATLARAYGLHQRVRARTFRGETEERAALIDIISECGAADERLNSQAETFSKLRNELIDAPRILDQLTQTTVDLRGRVPAARETLAGLERREGAEQIRSIADNPDMVESYIESAEAAITQGRTLAARPAGEQGGLVDAIGAARLATGQANDLLTAVEHAEQQLLAARSNLTALIDEVEGEIREANELLSGQAHIDRDGLAAAKRAAESALDKARTDGSVDALGSYSALLKADGDLDVELDEARGVSNDYRRTIDMVDRTVANVEQILRGVESTIHTRGDIIGVDTRTVAQSARDNLQAAYQARQADPRAALRAAHIADEMASEAADLAQKDIDSFNRRNQHSNWGGGGSGNLITGLVLGSLLSGNGGFGGGFGGGGGSFGGFGGGGDFGGGGSFGGSDSGSF